MSMNRQKNKNNLLVFTSPISKKTKLKQTKSGLWDADDTTLALKCQKGGHKSFYK